MQKRHCPKNVTGRCVNCKPYCHITTGFSGAGAFSDGKLSLSCEVGGELPELIGEELAQKTIEYTDRVYLEFGADTHVEGIGASDQVKQIRSRAIQAGLKLVDCPIRHLGTEKAQEIYLAIQELSLIHISRIAPGHFHGVAGDIYRMNVRGSGFCCIERKGAGMGKTVQHPLSWSQGGCSPPVILLIQEKTGFLAVFKVYCIPDAVFGDLRFGTVWNRDSVQREKAFVFGHSLQFSDGYVIAFVNAPDSLSVFCQQAIQFWKQ